MRYIYTVGMIVEPSTDSDDDMWYGHLDRSPITLTSEHIKHIGVIEVRGNSRKEVAFMLKELCDFLNSEKFEFRHSLGLAENDQVHRI